MVVLVCESHTDNCASNSQWPLWKLNLMILLTQEMLRRVPWCTTQATHSCFLLFKCSPLTQTAQQVPLKQIVALLLGASRMYLISLSSVSLGGFLLFLAPPSAIAIYFTRVGCTQLSFQWYTQLSISVLGCFL